MTISDTEYDCTYVFIHRSIKTRIETKIVNLVSIILILFLYIDPLKQGLKLVCGKIENSSITVFIHRSIKTRIETKFLKKLEHNYGKVFIHRSIKTRIETCNLEFRYFRRKNVFIHRSIKTRIETNLHQMY